MRACAIRLQKYHFLRKLQRKNMIFLFNKLHFLSNVNNREIIKNTRHSSPTPLKVLTHKGIHG